jgi:uncharacterized protein YjiS (DUF1127 family)
MPRKVYHLHPPTQQYSANVINIVNVFKLRTRNRRDLLTPTGKQKMYTTRFCMKISEEIDYLTDLGVNRKVRLLKLI